MSENYGKLVLLNPNGTSQEFILAKMRVSLGRNVINDIVLNDVRVSRDHAYLECGPSGVSLVDLGSSNGTRVNGTNIDRATLKPGDTIGLGSQQIKYLVEDPSEDVGLTKIDDQAELDQTLSEEFLPKIVTDTTSPGMVVCTAEKTWSIDIANQDLITIGRDESCTIFIDAQNISRRHAEVHREGDTFILNDLGSTNGTWVKGNKIDQFILNNGDTFRIGSVQIVFKSGFEDDALTMMDVKLAQPTGRRTIIFVPGLMGSELWLGNERVWPNIKTIFTNPELFTYPSNIPLEPRNIVDEVVIIPNFIKQDQYNLMGDYLVDELKYRRGVDYFEFAYDWRQDVRISARQLAELVEKIPADQPVIIIGHSLGTMVTRYYIEHLGGKNRIEKIILMGGPHKGAVKGLVSMLVAPQVLPFGLMGERLRQIMATFPSSYQILPDYAVGTDQHGDKINFLQDVRWLDPKYLPLLKLGQEFRQELGTAASTPTVCIFGYGVKTISDVSVIRDADGKLQNVDYSRKAIGDDAVLEQSAYLPGSDIHPVQQHHGTLFVDNDVRMRLKLELTRTF
jgi:pSer/pThr/pTyr-binding forkhead associated (FHA) protein